MKFLGPPSSGSMAGTTSSHNKAGQYTRSRRAPVQPIGTGRRATIRSAFGSASSAWAALTYAQQAAWTAYAVAHPILDALGQSIKLTGQQMFVSINTQLQNCLAPISNTPPVSSSVFAAAPATVQVTPLGLVYVQGSSLGSAADFQLVAFSKPQSGGVTFTKTFWQAGIQAGNDANQHDYSVQYVGEFGLAPVGGRVFFNLTPVNQYGVTGVSYIGFATVTNPGTAPVVTAGLTGVINWTNGGTVPAQWIVETQASSTSPWVFAQLVSGGTLTATGLTSGSKARIFGVDVNGLLTSEVSNTVTVV